MFLLGREPRVGEGLGIGYLRASHLIFAVLSFPKSAERVGAQ